MAWSPASSSSFSVRASRSCASLSPSPLPASDCGAITMKRRGSSAALRLSASSSGRESTVWLATTSVRFTSSRSASRSTTTCSTGRRVARFSAVDEALAQPAGARLGMGRDDDLVVVLLAERVHHGRVRIGVHHLAVGLDARLAQQRERHLEPVLGRVAHVLVVDHVAVLRLVLRADHVDLDLVALGAALAPRRSAACRPPSRWPLRGRASWVSRRGSPASAGRSGHAPAPAALLLEHRVHRARARRTRTGRRPRSGSRRS